MKKLVRLTGLSAMVFILAPLVSAQRVPGRYIVELTTEPVSEQVAKSAGKTGMRSAAAISQRTRVRNQQQQMRARIEQRTAKVLGSVDTVANAMFVQIPDADAAQLAALPGVKRVQQVRLMHLLLDRAVIVHKVADAWNQIGDANAGKGVKVAIVDTGIDVGHPGFNDTSLTMPAGFPKTNVDTDAVFTNSKVIVARSYVDLLPSRDPDLSARDRVGHGTALAMVAAGVRNAGPLATITGIAPKAWLGNYKVFGTPGFNDSASDDAILKALDDAVADGMDIISLSFGDDFAPRLADDLDVAAVERITQAGVIVVVAAGNNGPDLNTISSPATAPSAISAGASTNDRTFASGLDVPGLGLFTAINGDGAAPGAPVTGSMADVSALDQNGLACSPLPASSLTGKIALILRGTCTFEAKLANAQAAGAIAAIVYAAESSPSPIPMAVGAATLPAEMISNQDGVSIRNALASQDVVATIHFTLSAVPIPPNRLADFSAAGPSVSGLIKPEISAVGESIYVATQSFDQKGDMYDPSGYILVDGTSFSTPLIAGAAALLKGARPGLTVNQYRSLLINTAATVQTTSGGSATIQQGGAGVLDALAALNSPASAVPATVSFGAGGADIQFSKTVTVTNLSGKKDTFAIAVAPSLGDSAPSPGAQSVDLDSGASVDVPLLWNATGMTPGTYEGFVTITAASTGAVVRAPYWYAVTSDVPAHITILSTTDTGRRGRLIQDAFDFRITDVSGVAMPNLVPDVSVVSGGGSVRTIASADAQIPGVFSVDVVLGPTAGPNVYRVTIGNLTRDVSITAQ
ncbi:MAG: S8 family serine peptidase [Bryobacterales bacterium]|nr:S8 family serine peptidase [Bryobacterales bacterium]